MYRFLLALFIPLIFAGCATVPTALEDGPFAELTPKAALESETTGQRVRWGGSIVSVAPRQNETCFEILSRPLDGQSRPKQTDETYGRFLACANGFYDPAAYPINREITVIGAVQSPAALKIGEYEYRAPRVEVQRLYLWPKREIAYPSRYYDRYYDPFWDPWWGPWPYYRYPYHPYFW